MICQQKILFIKNKSQALYLLLVALHFLPLNAKSLNVNIESEGAILVNADTGAVLFEKNADKQYFPASITKIATAHYALKKLGEDLSTVVTVSREATAAVSATKKKRSNYSLPPHWLEFDASHMGLKVGERLPLHALIQGIMIVSAGDACNVIAEHVGSGSIQRFVSEMDGYLKEIGLTQTRFVNAHGLHHPDQVTTARDMALLTRVAMKDPGFRSLVRSTRFMRPETNKQDAVPLVNTNRLIKPGPYHYNQAIGVKTGYHSDSKRTFVAAAEQDGRTLIAVLLRCEDSNGIFTDAKKLFEAAYRERKVRNRLLKAGPQRFEMRVNGSLKALKTYTKEDLIYDYYPAEKEEGKTVLTWNELSLPIEKDAQVGTLMLRGSEGEPLAEVALFASEEVSTSLVSELFKHPLLSLALGLSVAFGAYVFLRGQAKR